MHYMPAKNLNMADERNVCYIDFSWQIGQNSHVSYPFHKPGWVYIPIFLIFNSKSSTQ